MAVRINAFALVFVGFLGLAGLICGIVALSLQPPTAVSDPRTTMALQEVLMNLNTTVALIETGNCTVLSVQLVAYQMESHSYGAIVFYTITLLPMSNAVSAESDFLLESCTGPLISQIGISGAVQTFPFTIGEFAKIQFTPSCTGCTALNGIYTTNNFNSQNFQLTWGWVPAPMKKRAPAPFSGTVVNFAAPITFIMSGYTIKTF